MNIIPKYFCFLLIYVKLVILYPEQIFGVMIELVRSLHDGMTATVTVGGGKSEPSSVRNG